MLAAIAACSGFFGVELELQAVPNKSRAERRVCVRAIVVLSQQDPGKARITGQRPGTPAAEQKLGDTTLTFNLTSKLCT
ncbi:MAG: hypothetical protein AAGA54_24360 [Myxococcota bacterium]